MQALLLAMWGHKIAYIRYDVNNNPVLIVFTDGSETDMYMVSLVSGRI